MCCSVIVAVCCSVLQCVAVCCSVLQCVTMCCSHPIHWVLSFNNKHTLLCVAVSLLQCIAVCCSVLQCVAVCCSVIVTLCCNVSPLINDATQFFGRHQRIVKSQLQFSWSCVAVCCSVLQSVAMCYSVLQCVTV